MPPIDKQITKFWGKKYQQVFRKKWNIADILDWENQLNNIIQYEDLHWTKKIFTKRPRLSKAIAKWIKKELKCKH